MGKLITVEFREDTIFALERDDGVYVAIKPIVQRLGLAWPRQFVWLQNDPVLAEGVIVTVIPSVGGMQETTCLRLDLVAGFLFGLEESRCRPDLREKARLHWRDCYRVLHEQFVGS